MGAVLFYSLPYRLGLPPASIIVLNWLLLLGSVGLTYVVLQTLEPAKGWRRWARIPAIGMGHLAFLWLPSWNSISDLPATVFALAAVQGVLLARKINRWWCYLATGVGLGLSVWLRAFFLYPAMLAGLALLLVAIPNPRRLLRRCAVLVMFLPILMQYRETYLRTKLIGFIYPPFEAEGRRIHFNSTLAGYDTSLSGGVRYDARECFRHSRNVKDAVAKRDVSALACIGARRHAFYFGSYTVGGRVYLGNQTERHRSWLLLTVSTLVLVGSLGRLFLRGRRPESLVVGLFMLAVWGQSMAIVPEARFIYLILVWMWSDLLCAAIAWENAGVQRWKSWRKARVGGVERRTEAPPPAPEPT